MGLFAKLREGLTKTRDSLMGRVDTLVKETRKIDEDFYEELEDILLMSDCGMKATTAIMDELRRRVSENKVKDADTAKQMLKDIMIEQMDIPASAAALADGHARCRRERRGQNDYHRQARPALPEHWPPDYPLRGGYFPCGGG